MKHGGSVTRDGSSELAELVSAGFVPVLHGDAAVDAETGCCILSADSILEVF